MFSILIPTYNDPFLERAIKSVLYKNYSFQVEVIIINDGGNQKEFSDLIYLINDKIIKSITIDNSGGPARPRNIGLKLAKYKYLLFLDSDDFWLPGKLDLLYKILYQNTSIDFIWHNVKLESRRIKWPWSYKFSANNLLKHGNFIVLSSVCIKRDLTRDIRFNESQFFHGVEDYDFCLQLSRKILISRTLFLRKRLGVYNDIGDHHLSKQSKMILRYHRVFENHSTKEYNKLYLFYRLSRYYSFFDMNPHRRKMLYFQVLKNNQVLSSYRLKSTYLFMCGK